MNRMFQVIVLGGISLAGPACGTTVDVASQGATSGSSGGSGAGGFPQEGAPPPSGLGGGGGFPQEGPMILDAGFDSPMTSDAGDASPSCFPPDETAFACPDAGAATDGGP